MYEIYAVKEYKRGEVREGRGLKEGRGQNV